MIHHDHLGYSYYSPDNTGCPFGHTRMEVNLFDRPTGKHFDPEKMRVTIITPDETIDFMMVTHPWHGWDQYRLGAGRVILTDRLGKVCEGFTFGGELTIVSDDHLVHCLLSSPVPILELVSTHCADMLFVSQLEAQLARRRSHWRKEHHAEEFDRRLAAVDPLTLFVAGLWDFHHWLLTKSARIFGPCYEQARLTVSETIRDLRRQGEWIDPPPRLEDLL